MLWDMSNCCRAGCLDVSIRLKFRSILKRKETLIHVLLICTSYRWFRLLACIWKQSVKDTLLLKMNTAKKTIQLILHILDTSMGTTTTKRVNTNNTDLHQKEGYDWFGCHEYDGFVTNVGIPSLKPIMCSMERIGW